MRGVASPASRPKKSFPKWTKNDNLHRLRIPERAVAFHAGCTILFNIVKENLEWFSLLTFWPPCFFWPKRCSYRCFTGMRDNNHNWRVMQHVHQAETCAARQTTRVNIIWHNFPWWHRTSLHRELSDHRIIPSLQLATIFCSCTWNIGSMGNVLKPAKNSRRPLITGSVLR